MNRLRNSVKLLAALLSALVLISGCGAASSESEKTRSAQGSDGFPVTIEHAFGTTRIEAKPERVATISWGNHEVPLALGVVPVGMSKATWGDDNNNGILPWVEDKLQELGGETPALFDETDGLPYEEIANTQPDVILAAYSGLTKEEYETLSKIAPVVAYPDLPWSTSYEDMIKLNSKALGLSDEGDKLIDTLHSEVANALEKNAALKSAKTMFAYIDPADFSKIGFYTTHDTRPGFLASVGVPTPAVVTEESAKSDEFYVTISAEQADRLNDVDLVITYGDPSSDLLAKLQADPLLSKIPAIAKGQVAILENSTPLAAMGNPAPLSISWGIDRYLGELAQALPAS